MHANQSGDATARPTPDDLIALNREATVARLLPGLAHEVNNALLVVSGTAELLEEQPGPSGEVGKGMARIRAQTARAAAVIAQVLDFVRGDPDARGRLNLRDIAATAVALRAYAVHRAGLSISIEPAEERRVIVHGSRVLLQQAVLNLIVNAEQALAGTRGGVIRLVLTEADDRAALRVTDTGPGIAAGERERIFEPFRVGAGRAHAHGLGLPAARRIAEGHGGTLMVGATASGAELVLTLPVVVAGPPRAAEAATPSLRD